MKTHFSLAVLVLLVGCAGSSTVGSPSPGSVTGTVWRLVELDGNRLTSGIVATVELSKDGRVVGRGSCNRFSGAVAISGDRIEFGPLVSTKMSCGDAADEQERRYLEVLKNAVRFAFDEPALLVYSLAADKPLRFVPK